MKYWELDFNITPSSNDAADVLMALVADAGLESFIDTERGFKGYAQTGTFQRSVMDSLLKNFPLNGIEITYQINEAENRNWNEEWERTGFEPVRIAESILIHSPQHNALTPAQYDILINPHQAFGTGTHQTTSMILERLLNMELKHSTVLDAGCGTSVLGIFCSQKGASHIFAYDIDDWSVNNTKENMALNGVTNMEVAEGDVTVLPEKKTFDIILANINRNILLQDIPAFYSAMHKGSRMILSGFYLEDIPIIRGKAEALGLTFIEHREKDNWASILFERTI